VSTPGHAFPTETLELLARTVEVDIETRSSDGTLHSTVIWVVVTEDVPYIRSYRGPTARWYRELTAAPDAVLVADGQRLAIRAVRAVDEASVDACSRGLEAKYAGDPATPAMVAPSNLPTTLRLEPR
jgi:hypothetical protein